MVVGRDLALTDRIWSSRSGYPRGPHYRDFHTYDDESGFRPARVTDAGDPRRPKAPYDPDAALAHAHKDAHDFVDAVHRRLTEIARRRDGRPGLAVVAYDTELFGHWWHEGPAFLEHVLRLLPQAGVRLSTLSRAIADAPPPDPVELAAGSWGAGKDFRIWAGDAVRDLAADGRRVAERLVQVAQRAAPAGSPRRPDLDQAAREALLALSSDWAFMVSRDSAADYARARAAGHARDFDELARLVEGGDPLAGPLAATLQRVDGVFGHLDGRLLHTAHP